MSGAHFLPLTDTDRQEMLRRIGASGMEELFSDIPDEVRLRDELRMDPPLSEMEVLAHLSDLAAKNRHCGEYISFLGAGVYDHFIPAAVKHVIARSEFYTAYTPYQAEISQGLLQAIWEYQSMLCMLTGMDAANASMYDGGSALAEAAMLAASFTRRKEILVSRSVSPFYRRVLETYAAARGLILREAPLREGKTDLDWVAKHAGDGTAALVAQTPNFFGLVEHLAEAAAAVHRCGGLLVVAADPLSLAVLEAPGAYGADVVAGEAQCLGSPPSFGGPLLGYFAVKQQLLRYMPGRVVGETVDSEGRRGFVLTLQTREQHIRRERATSNICSNQALNALAAAVYMALLGPRGLKEAAELCLRKAAYARERIAALAGYDLPFAGPHFKEFAVRLPLPAATLNRRLLDEKIIGGLDLAPYYPELSQAMLLSVTEKRTRVEIDRLVQLLEGWAQ